MSIHIGTIPTGRAARTLWRALPRGIRAEVIRLARQGWPHPDLDVARVAVGWARPVRVRAQRIWLLVYVPLLILSAIPVQALPERYQNPVILAKSMVSLAVAAVAAPILVYVIRHRRAAQVEAANLRALIAADRAAPRALTVHRTGLFGLLDLIAVTYLVAAAGMAVEWLALRRMASAEPPPTDIPPDAERFVELEIALTTAFVVFGVLTAFLFFVVVPAILTVLLTLRPRGTGPLATVDSDGMSLPHLRLTLPWDEIAEVDVAFPAPHSRWSDAIGLWIMPRDPAAIVARSGLPWWRRVLLSRWLGLFHRALYVPAGWMCEPPETVVGAARRWSQAIEG